MDVSGSILQTWMPAIHAGNDQDLRFRLLYVSASSSTPSSANWIVNANELGAIGECCFHLHLVEHFGDAFHDLIAGQYLAAFGHEFGDRLTVSCSLHTKSVISATLSG